MAVSGRLAAIAVMGWIVRRSEIRFQVSEHGVFNMNKWLGIIVVAGSAAFFTSATYLRAQDEPAKDEPAPGAAAVEPAAAPATLPPSMPGPPPHPPPPRCPHPPA